MHLLTAMMAGTEWDRLRTVSGTASDIPRHFIDLLEAKDDKAARDAYWKLDNHVLVQGRAFSSAPALLPFALAAASMDGLGAPARRWIVELVTEIALAKAHEDEPNPAEIERAIVDCLESSTWLFYGLIADIDPRIRCAGVELVSRYESDSRNLSALASFLEGDSDERVRSVASRRL